MAGSPFKGGASAAVKSAPAPAAAAPAATTQKRGGAVDPADLPDVTNVGEQTTVGNDPYAAADPTGISGYKPAAFLGQLVLMHATEAGSRATSVSKPGEENEFVRFDIIPLTLPEAGTPNMTTTVATEEGFASLNKDGEVEVFEAYAVGERLDDIMVYNKALIREGKRALDKGTAWLLGRIIKGNKKPGQSAPYILVAGSDEDKALYQQWRQSLVK